MGRKIITLIIAILMILSAAACSNKEQMTFTLKDADCTWEKRTLESGEEYLYDTVSKTMILKAYRYAGSGYGGGDKYEEIPIDDYLANKNTWQTIAGEQALKDSFTLCDDKNEDFTREGWITVFGESERTTVYFGNDEGGLRVSAPDGGEIEIPRGYTFYEQFTPVISLKWGKLKGNDVYECVSIMHQNGSRDGIIEFCIQK